MSDIRKPISSESVAWEEFSEGTRFGSRFKHLTKAVMGTNYHVGMAIEELPPGMQSCPFHYHMLEEEHILILEGTLTLRLGEEKIAMKAGDYVCFPAGQLAGHCLLNEGDKSCRYVIVGEREQNEVCVYPDSNKVMVRALQREGDIFDLGAAKDYWDGEKTV
jgi:uncharacterized cupin superfamily protein